MATSQSMSQSVRIKGQTAKGIPHLIHGETTKLSVTLEKLDDVTIPVKSELQVKTEFETELMGIAIIVPCPDGNIWICDVDSEIVQRVKPNGDKLSVISDIDIQVCDAALIPSGDLLLSVVDSSDLKLIPSGSTDISDSVFTVTPLYPTAVHVTHENKIIVGAKEAGPLFPVKGPRKVIVMDQTGHEEKVFEYDRYNKPLFTLPCCITSERKGNIVVIDMVCYDRGRVVVLNKEGEVRIYTGHPDVNNEDKPFKPTGITTTPSDNFVIADNLTLHILNNEGEIITFYNTEKMGILLSWSLSFSTTGQLYIGCDTSEDKQERAKLCVIENFLY